MKPPIPLEADEQAAFLLMFRAQWPNTVIFAVPNASKRKATAIRQARKEGLLPGAPDLVVLGWGLGIEMKRRKASYLTDEQKHVHAALEANGCTVITGYGAEDAFAKVKVWRASQ